MMSRNVAMWAILFWGAVVWGGRIAIIFDSESDLGDRGRIAVALAVSLAAFLALRASSFERPIVGLYAAVTAYMWIRSLVVVLSDGRSAGFIAVHALLAAVSLGLAAWAAVIVWRAA
jgi:hypothetical protein